MKQVTMQDIADTTGVSLMTVSLALRNHPKISAQTTAKIQRLAVKLGYRPNPMVSALMREVRKGRLLQQPICIGYLAFKSTSEWDRSHQGYFSGANTRCNELGYKLEKLVLEKEDMSTNRIGQILHARAIQGVILAPLKQLSGRSLDLDWRLFSCATLGHSILTPQLHRSASHQYRNMFELMRQAHARGYTRPGMVITEEASSRTSDHHLAAFSAFSLRYSPGRLYPLLLVKSHDHRQIYRWFCKHKPDILICPWSHYPYLKLREHYGIRIPQDVAFATCAYNPDKPEIAGMRQNSAAVGSAAVDLVIEQLQQNERGIPRTPKTVLIESHWVDGASAPSKSAHLFS